ncbi:MAG TPA: lipo-like protein [Rhodocyclaceae bacterium]|nr:MAG: lipo-like protein [Betaproteobacteria bacterium CG2_30_68_42]PIV72575.1 MAG: lipo-like protein [Rhodocyclales bacterium CG17_big_fil_post_rev_8_21_14_2_50_68_7]PJA57149.1 MAG: lipo-like protein [Rhodocyclales bacterium CG_4_9_14_3_um_filter_68_10]HCX34417.1 lipo-like protein [Rhodocyclaceae bacterium]
MNGFQLWLGRAIGRYLSRRLHTQSASAPSDPARLAATLRPADVLLVEGNTRVSAAIKYLTQSTWSHAALYVGNASGMRSARGEALCLLEADILDGVRVVPLSEFDGLHTRICRPVGLSAEEVERVVRYACERIGYRYDLKNAFDLARYLLPMPPVPQRWRRRMLALGSGDPTRAICSTLIAQAFQSIRYPILPAVETVPSTDPDCTGCMSEILHIRHHSLFAPRDFDVSPYFEVVKPTLVDGFDHRSLTWAATEG